MMGPEALGAKHLRRLMTSKGRYLKKIHGGKYQSGLPDLLALHPLHGCKWIETKAAGGKLSTSQVLEFSQLEKYGLEIFILESDKHYDRIFGKPNWRNYIRGFL